MSEGWRIGFHVRRFDWDEKLQTWCESEVVSEWTENIRDANDLAHERNVESKEKGPQLV